KKGVDKWKLWTLRLLMLIAVFYGSVKTAESAWILGDIGVGIMAWLNLTAIFFLRKPAMKALKDYDVQLKAGIDPVFDAEKLGIKNADEWTSEKVEKIVQSQV